MKRYINEAIDEYLKEGNKPWHMPGHKRVAKGNPIYRRDFTEIPGLDDYYYPEDIIKKSFEEITKVYGTYKSYYLVNGSTVGNLAAIFACCKYEKAKGKLAENRKQSENKKPGIIIARNCHKSVFNALSILDITPIYVYPEYIEDGKMYGPIKSEKIVEAIDKNWNIDILACVITSPTYEGVISDVAKISEELHKRNIKLIVDEAHGAHLPFAEKLAESAIRKNADVVIQSLHKTLPALTQTAVIHIPYHSDNKKNPDKEDIADYEILDEKLREYIAVFQTSSPSYIFMQDMENCIAYSDENRDEFDKLIKKIDSFRKKMKNLKHIRLLDKGDYIYDRSRLVFIFDGLDADKIKSYIEEKYHMIFEMSGLNHITAITSIKDTEKDFESLYSVVAEVDKLIAADKTLFELNENESEVLINTEKGEVNIKDAEGLRIRNYVYVYPPGIPIIAPYEVINRDMINEILLQKRAGKTIRT